MKASIISRISLLFFAVIALATVTSCNKDDDHDHDGTGHMHVHFNNKYGLTDGLEYDSLHTGSNDRDFTVSTLRYYVSNVRLVAHDGTEVALDSTYLLVKTGEENELEFEELPAGHYTQIKFDLGIDSTTNHSDPSTYPATSPLAPQTPAMHWSWNSGYIFFMMEGLVDTTAAKSGVVDGPWAFHVGGDSYLLPVTLTIDKTVDEDNHPGLNINLNVAALFNNIDLGGADISTHTMDNMMLANKIKTNLGTAFTVE